MVNVLIEGCSDISDILAACAREAKKMEERIEALERENYELLLECSDRRNWQKSDRA
jgi:hypothetical protein